MRTAAGEGWRQQSECRGHRIGRKEHPFPEGPFSGESEAVHVQRAQEEPVSSVATRQRLRGYQLPRLAGAPSPDAETEAREERDLPRATHPMDSGRQGRAGPPAPPGQAVPVRGKGGHGASPKWSLRPHFSPPHLSFSLLLLH